MFFQVLLYQLCLGKYLTYISSYRACRRVHDGMKQLKHEHLVIHSSGRNFAQKTRPNKLYEAFTAFSRNLELM